MAEDSIARPAEQIIDRSPGVPLWRDAASAPVSDGPQTPSLTHVFPSGRQALTAALQLLGLSRRDRVAIPEWSSACVISAVGAVATPIPMAEALVGGHAVSALLHYDQWGWPCPKATFRRMCEQFPDIPIIVDRVDTPDTKEDARLPDSTSHKFVELWSLSKTLGLSAGGLLRIDGQWTDASRFLDPNQAWPCQPAGLSAAHIIAIAKANCAARPPAVENFVNQGSISGSLDSEAAQRRESLAAIRRSERGAEWPRWMHLALDQQAAPGLAPLYRGRTSSELAAIRDQLQNDHKIESSLYHFNYSGDPTNPDYQLCLAVPTHGQLEPSRLQAALPQAVSPKTKVVMSTSADPAIVVGGGIAGLAAALFLAERGPVTIIERAPELGGLMRSFEGPDDLSFDLGTHFVLATGYPELDDVLFDGCQGDDWWQFTDSLREGHYFNGHLNTDTGCLDLTHFPDESLERMRKDMLARTAASGPTDTLEQSCLQSHGPAVTQSVFAPVMQKLSGQALSTLDPDSTAPFSLGRVVAYDRETSRALKQAPSLDAKLAFASSRDGSSSITKYYPRRGGVGRWVNQLVDRLSDRGVTIETNRAVEKVSIEDGQVVAVTLDGDETRRLPELIWTVPAALFLRAASVPFKSEPPVMRDLGLIHFATHQPLRTDLHWVCCYDTEFLTYRVTQYPNIGLERRPPPHHLTVEILCDRDTDLDAAPPRIWDELKLMGLIDSDAAPYWTKVQRLPSALPVRTRGFGRAQKKLLKSACETASNVRFLGRAAGSHFQIDTLRSVFSALAEH